MRDVFFSRLAESHPHLVVAYRRRHRNRSYAPEADQAAIGTLVRDLVRRHGGVTAERTYPEHRTGTPGDQAASSVG